MRRWPCRSRVRAWLSNGVGWLGVESGRRWSALSSCWRVGAGEEFRTWRRCDDTAGVAASVPSSSFSALAPTIQSAMAANAIPGAVVLVRDGHEAWAQAFGTRVVGEDDPVSVFDHFRVGSNTKTMVGTVVLQLVEEGRIGLDDPVSQYRPDVPNGENITIAQLLDMRSGLATYSNLEWFNAILDEDPTRVWDPEELAAIGLALPPAFPPGEGFLYSNTNTVLLGLIIEQLTGQSLTDVLAERIFGPLGLADTAFPPPADSTLPEPHPNGYLFGTNVSTLTDAALSPEDQAAAVAGRLRPNDVSDLNPSWGWAAGAATSTAEDLATYVEALVGGGLLTPQLQRERLDSVRPIDVSNPASAEYGLALARFGPMLGHDGSLPGFQSFMGHDPDRDLTLIVLTNLQSTPDGDGSANALAKLIIAQLYPTPAPPTSPSPPGAEA